jgi:hypothetical protein
MDQEKRQLRKLKRDVKRAGNKHRRQQLKRDLVENPEEAHESEERFGRHRSEGFNGMDSDTTRRGPAYGDDDGTTDAHR